MWNVDDKLINKVIDPGPVEAWTVALHPQVTAPDGAPGGGLAAGMTSILILRDIALHHTFPTYFIT